jgi:cytochrome c-type biogenesis protein CcmH
MLFWFIAIATTAIACAALFYAAGSRSVNAAPVSPVDANSHFKALLAGIDTDLAAGKLSESEAIAARSELAREVIRARSDTARETTSGQFGRVPLLLGLVAVAGLSLGLYGWLGQPDLPAQPLAERQDIAASAEFDFDEAITRIESALAQNPDDIEGWRVIAPAYTGLGRFADAANAYRRIISLSEPTPALQLALAEALILDANGASSLEAMDLLRSAADAEPENPIPRFYMAAQLTQQGDHEAAIPFWNEAIGLAAGDEPWLAAARQGLAVAQSGGVEQAATAQSEQIGQMVAGLAERLASEGGTVEEWIQLVRAYLVLEETALAQQAFDDAVAAYPAAFDRGELDTLALGAGLTLNGVQP